MQMYENIHHLSSSLSLFLAPSLRESRSYLNDAIPTGGNDDGICMIWRKAYTANPIQVSVVLYGVLALCQCVPQFNGLVPRPGNDLTIVDGKSDAENVLPDGKETHNQ